MRSTDRVISAVQGRIGLSLLLLLGAGVQVAAIVGDRIHWNSDQAVVGLMARHILHLGENPVFYYGSYYAGSLEPHFVAVILLFFGSSIATYRLAMMILLALILIATYAIGRRAFGRVSALIAVSYLAVPPFFFLYKGLTSDGAYDTLTLLGAGLLYGASRLDEAFAAGAPTNEWVALIGFLAGLGWWVDPLIGCFYVAVLAWFLLVRPTIFRRVRDYPLFGFFFMLGSLPWWIFNLRDRWASLLVRELATVPTAMAIRQFKMFWTLAVPVLFGARVAPGYAESLPGASVIATSIYFVPMIVAVVVLASATVAAGRGAEPFLTDRANRVLLLLVLSIGAMQALVSWNARTYLLEPRFLFPIYVPFALVLGLTLHLASSALPQWLVISVGLAIVAFNAVGIAQAPRVGDIETRPTSLLEPNAGTLRPLIRALAERNICEVYTSYWTGYRLMFESGERVVAASFGGLHDSADRYPPYADRVRRSPNPGLVLWGTEARQFADYLRLRGAANREVRVGPYTVFWNVAPQVLKEIAGLRRVPDER